MLLRPQAARKRQIAPQGVTSGLRHANASTTALRFTQHVRVVYIGAMTPTLSSLHVPAIDAPLWVQHAWLCHGADPDGSNGEPCPDGCDGYACDPDRLAAYQAAEGTEDSK